MIRYTKWGSRIIFLAIASAVLNVYAKDAVTCSLNMDCVFSSYNDKLYISTIEKTDYKCRVTQKNNISAHGAKSVINLVTGYKSTVGYRNEEQAIELGGDKPNEGNLYFPSRMIDENGKLIFVVEKKSPYWVDKIADISINCIKI